MPTTSNMIMDAKQDAWEATALAQFLRALRQSSDQSTTHNIRDLYFKLIQYCRIDSPFLLTVLLPTSSTVEFVYFVAVIPASPS